MSMIRVNNVEIEHLAEIIPPDYYFWSELWSSHNKEIYMFVLKEDEETIGTAVYQTCQGEKTYVCCVYVTVLENYRRKGYATKLLQQSREELRAEGYGNLWAVTVGEPDEIVKGLLDKCGMAVKYEETNMGYFIGQLKTSEVASKFSKAGAFKDVKKIDEIGDYALRKLSKKKLVQSVNVGLKNFNRKLSRFFVVDDEVMGVLLADSKDDEIFYSIEIAVEPSEKTKLALPLMLFSLVEEIVEEAGEEAGLIIGFDKEKQVEAMQKYFGDSEENIKLSFWK